MKIAFDLDDTLIPLRREHQVEHVGLPLRPLFPEGLRAGSRGLLRTLRDDEHEIWIYTTSYRSAWRVSLWLRLQGVAIAGMVNQARHERTVGSSPSKDPRAFGLDLLVDDSLGVAHEGRQHGFEVAHVVPEDDAWTSTVLDAVRRLAAGSGSGRASDQGSGSR